MLFKLQKMPVPQERIIEEMRLKAVLYRGHYLLRSGECTDTYIVARRAPELYAMRRQLVNVLLDLPDFDPDNTLYVAMSRDACTIIRAIHDLFEVIPKQFLYIGHMSGEMTLSEAQVKRLRKQPFIVIDDVVRKGRALTLLIDLCAKHDLKPASIIAAVNSGLTEVHGTPIASLVQIKMQQWDNPQVCRLCKEGTIPLHDPHHFDR